MLRNRRKNIKKLYHLSFRIYFKNTLETKTGSVYAYYYSIDSINIQDYCTEKAIEMCGNDVNNILVLSISKE